MLAHLKKTFYIYISFDTLLTYCLNIVILWKSRQKVESQLSWKVRKLRRRRQAVVDRQSAAGVEAWGKSGCFLLSHFQEKYMFLNQIRIRIAFSCDTFKSNQSGNTARGSTLEWRLKSEWIGTAIIIQYGSSFEAFNLNCVKYSSMSCLVCDAILHSSST